MRSFAAATVAAVAAAVLVATGLVVSTVGSLESLGLLAGRSTVQITDLPFGLTKPEQIQQLAEIADDSDVALSMLVPDREGRPGVWSAYVLRGAPAEPVFDGSLRVRPIGGGGELDLRTAYAVGGDGAAVDDFLEDLRAAGYRYKDLSPAGFAPLAAALGKPGILAAVTANTLGVTVALIAESGRRETRQVVRRTVGWSRRRITVLEAASMAALSGTAVLISLGGLSLYLLLQHADRATGELIGALEEGVLAPVAVALVLTHTALGVLRARESNAALPVRWPRVAVGAAAVALVALSVADVRALAVQHQLMSGLERTLVAEARHGDDVVLGTGFTDFDQDVALGRLARGPLDRGEASMAQSSFVDQFTVVGDATVRLRQYDDVVSRFDGDPVLLVPKVLESDLEPLRRAAAEDIATGWQVEERDPPEDVEVHAVPVPTTAAITQSIVDWTRAVPPTTPTWPEIPVLVVPHAADLAPNRIGTAVANGEVRFTSKPALERAVREAGLADVVLQVRRVGATVEGQIAALRSERLTAELASLVTGLAVVFAALSLVVDLRVRSARSARLRFLSGRHPAVRHRGFVGGAVALTVGVTELVLGSSVIAALAASGAAGIVAAVLLTALLVVHGRNERHHR